MMKGNEEEGKRDEKEGKISTEEIGKKEERREKEEIGKTETPLKTTLKKNFFPHETIREGQEEMLNDFAEALEKKRFLLAHAPTGIGKTATALSMAIKHALEQDKVVFFLTNRHTQHQIAIHTLRLIKEKIDEKLIIVDLIGKRWMCNQEIAGLFGTDFTEFCKTVVERGECEFYNNALQKKNLTVEAKRLIAELEVKSPLHNEEVIRLCKTEKMCSYEISLALAKKAKVIIGDYNYIFNPFIQSTIFNKLEISLDKVIVIVDEGHNLSHRILEMLSTNLTSFMLKNSMHEAKKFGYGGVIHWLQEVENILNGLLNGHSSGNNSSSSSLSNLSGNSSSNLFSSSSDNLSGNPLGNNPPLNSASSFHPASSLVNSASSSVNSIHSSFAPASTLSVSPLPSTPLSSTPSKKSNFGTRSFSPSERLVKKEEFVKLVQKIVDYDLLISELEEAAEEIRKKQRKSYLGGIANFLQQWKGEDKGYARIISKTENKYGELVALSYLCLDPSFVSKDIFSQTYAGLIMSGTLNPTFMHRDLLGVERSVEKEYHSPFPPENKLTIIIPETTTKFTSRNDMMYKTIAGKCSHLISLIPGNAALFFPSYYLRDQISNLIKTTKKLFWEKNTMTKEEKGSLLDDFKQEKEKGGVLLGVTGANFAEGIDFPGDILNGVVVIGLPLGKPDLKTNELIKYYDEKFKQGWDYGYTFPAMSKCIQSAGRCIRSETDRGVVIYLDERFSWERYFKCFPERVRLIVTKDYEKRIKDFFSRDS